MKEPDGLLLDSTMLNTSIRFHPERAASNCHVPEPLPAVGGIPNDQILMSQSFGCGIR